VESYKKFSATLQAYRKSGEFTPMTQCLVEVFGAEKRNHALLCSQCSDFSAYNGTLCSSCLLGQNQTNRIMKYLKLGSISDVD